MFQAISSSLHRSNRKCKQKHLSYLQCDSECEGRFCQVLKEAVGTTFRQNEAELKISMEIDHQTSPTDYLLYKQSALPFITAHHTNTGNHSHSRSVVCFQHPLQLDVAPIHAIAAR